MNAYLLFISVCLSSCLCFCNPTEEVISSTIESLQPLLRKQQLEDPHFFQSLSEITSWRLQPQGDEGSYLLQNKEGDILFIAKPFDEAIYCINNPKGHTGAFEKRVKKEIPLYRSAQTEALCYEIATLCDIKHVVPKTRLYLFPMPEEKLCSIQEYLPNTLSLRSFLLKMFSLGITEKELEPYLEQEDFADICLLMYLIYDNDAHASNILLSAKTQNKDTYHLTSIDHSLSLPEKNEGFFPFIMYLPNALHPLSLSIQEKISHIPMQEIQDLFFSYQLASSFPAFKERVLVLQTLSKRDQITYYEVFARLLLLKKPEGLSLALSDIPLQEIEALLPL